MGVKLSRQACEISGCTQCSTLISTFQSISQRLSFLALRVEDQTLMKSFSFCLPSMMRVTQSSKLQFRAAAKMDISACQLSTCQHSGDRQAQDMTVETAVDDFFPIDFHLDSLLFPGPDETC